MCNNVTGKVTIEVLESMASQLEEIAIQFRNVADVMRIRKISKVACGDETEACNALESLLKESEKVCRQLREF